MWVHRSPKLEQSPPPSPEHRTAPICSQSWVQPAVRALAVNGPREHTRTHIRRKLGMGSDQLTAKAYSLMVNTTVSHVREIKGTVTRTVTDEHETSWWHGSQMTGCHGNAQHSPWLRTLYPTGCSLMIVETEHLSYYNTHTPSHCFWSGSKWTQISLLCAFGIRAVI